MAIFLVFILPAYLSLSKYDIPNTKKPSTSYPSTEELSFTWLSCLFFVLPVHLRSSNPSKDQSYVYSVVIFLIQKVVIILILNVNNNLLHLHTVEPLVDILILDILVVFTYTMVQILIFGMLCRNHST